MNKYRSTPQKILDLHGCTRSEAKTVLLEVFKNGKCDHIRIITGKGTFREQGPVLRNFVKSFLYENDIRYCQSRIEDGGEGALEIYL